MHDYRRVALPALISFALAGCAVQPAAQRGGKEAFLALQPIDVTVGIQQSELYAAYEVSRTGEAAANGCAAVPGLGLLLAMACGGAGAAVDAKVNAERAKVADETIRSAKDQVVDIKFDELMNAALSKELRAMPETQIAGFSATKNVAVNAYEEAYRASTANGVMFITVDYHVSRDFCRLQAPATGLLYPRKEPEPKLAGSSADRLNTTESVLAAGNAARRSNAFYELRLPMPVKTSPAECVAAWKADGARTLRLGLQNATVELARMTAENLQREPVAKEPRGTVVKRNGGELIRHRDGSTHFNLSTQDLLDATASTAAATSSAETTSQ